MRLNRDKRYQIKALPEIGIFQKDIARMLGISPGGLSKEISRNGGAKRYDPEKAERRTTKTIEDVPRPPEIQRRNASR